MSLNFESQWADSAVAGPLGGGLSVPAKSEVDDPRIDPKMPVMQGISATADDFLTDSAYPIALVAVKGLEDSVMVAKPILSPLVGNEAEPKAGGEPVGQRSEAKAATKLQKVYRSYRTRRRLADSAVFAEELWWQALDFARLNHSTISFFNYMKPETAISRWNRVSIIASKVGQGLSKDEKALKLAFQHWIEAIDPRHRYGHNLHFYYEKWCHSDAGQPFFYWLDLGDGKNVELKECPRSLLRQQCIKYMGSVCSATRLPTQERKHYEYVLADGKIVHKRTVEPLDTTKGPKGAKWIFVMSTSRRLYAGVKQRGVFQHSSFLAGGTTVVAGRFTAEGGFLQIRSPSSEDYEVTKTPEVEAGDLIDAFSIAKPPPLQIPSRPFITPSVKPMESSINSEAENGKGNEIKAYRRTLTGGLRSPKPDVSEKAIQERIKSKLKSSSFQLGHQVSLKWSTGAGPRIGCVADYPVELRLQALEFTNLSPTYSPTLTQHP